MGIALLVQFRVIPDTGICNPLARFAFLHFCGDQFDDSGDRSGFRKVRLKNLHAVTGGVGVAVDNPWNYRAPVQINHLCLGALELEHVLIISDRQNFSIADRDGFKNVILRINGDDLPGLQDERGPKRR